MSKIGGSSRSLLDNEQDLVALNDPVDNDLLSRLLRIYWPFSGQVRKVSLSHATAQSANSAFEPAD